MHPLVFLSWSIPLCSAPFPDLPPPSHLPPIAYIRTTTATCFPAARRSSTCGIGRPILAGRLGGCQSWEGKEDDEKDYAPSNTIERRAWKAASHAWLCVQYSNPRINRPHVGLQESARSGRVELKRESHNSILGRGLFVTKARRTRSISETTKETTSLKRNPGSGAPNHHHKKTRHPPLSSRAAPLTRTPIDLHDCLSLIYL